MSIKARLAKLERESPPPGDVETTIVHLPRKDPHPDGTPSTSPPAGDVVVVAGGRRIITRWYDADDRDQARTPASSAN